MNPIVKALKDLSSIDVQDQITADETLKTFTSKIHVPFITETINSTKNTNIRAKLAHTLGQIPVRASTDLLYKLLDDNDPIVKSSATFALSFHQTSYNYHKLELLKRIPEKRLTAEIILESLAHNYKYKLRKLQF